MSKRYEMKQITDIFDIPEGSFDDFLVDLKAYYQMGRSLPALLEEVADAADIKAKVLPQHMVWIDDGKHDATAKITVANEESES